IAPDRALSLQVHPDRERARTKFAEENEAGIPLDSPRRNYKDPNHKPEMLYALTTFQAMAGFRAPRRAAELLKGLGTDLSERLYAVLRAQPDAEGVAAAFASLLTERPSPQDVADLAQACAARLAEGSISPRVDENVVRLQEQYPGDPGVVAPLLLNPVTLQPGEAMFVPAGSVHAYMSGLGIEVMASSDNVLRAGLTAKPIDVPEMLACVDYVAAPPIRIAPEHIGEATQVFYSPVDDFELAITTVTEADGEVEIPGRSARIILGVAGEVTIRSGDDVARLAPGQAVLVRADDARPTASGNGTVAQADVP
ncbi:MAG TPA: mannose-6-phosphate isomerase, class I, partial [Actinomycetales bacterium]|nr:mannose-6-phosphate isomerase, class I [Actinomycetales bacterium]